jgi:exonuclease VII small subunit
MGSPPRLRSGAVAAVVALSVPVLACPPARASVAATAAASAQVPAGARPVADPAPGPPTPGESVPSESDVSTARGAADEAAQEVADITAQLEAAEARLENLQRTVAEAVSAHEQAQEALTDAESDVRRATEALAVARQAREDADRAVSAEAALIYMQGGSLQNLTTLLLSPPGAISDLAVVLDGNAHRVRAALQDATAAAEYAASQERLLVAARDNRSVAADQAGAARDAAERDAEAAGAEAARLGEQQAQLTARLDELQQSADDLSARREAAARQGTALLGLQSGGAAGAGPRAAQEIARAMMPAYGWDDAQLSCLVPLWNAESGWSWSATNASSGAYGIPQALPGWKMSSAGSDWLTNPATQIAWGLTYIQERYGSPCRTWDIWQSRIPHWY